MTRSTGAYDAVGNFTATQNGSQTRRLNAQNQITAMTGGSPTYFIQRGHDEQARGQSHVL